MHATAAVVGIVLVTVIFFFIYLPVKTNHGDTITVPNVIGVEYEELDDFLTRRNLRYEITEDSSYTPDYPPLAVLKQFPLPHSKVKENRKVYLTLNAEKPPLVRMPKLIEGSVKNAQLVLKTYDLKLGEIEYVPLLALNYILEQRYEGREILEGEMIPKGSVIDLVAGDGLGRQVLQSPNLTGLDLESAQFAIIGSGLTIGDITYEKEGVAVIEQENSDGETVYREEPVPPGTVFRQRPRRGTEIRLKSKVHIWVYRPDSISVAPTLLDQE
ncbi:MAG: PASTA domain-containing protein [Cyclobacteriaceae bacterium]|nr:PASTA domain-containing protein [Cyclobacteriaceae bacterium HetDA_MAG_MS6]